MFNLDGRFTCITADDIDTCGFGIGQLIFCFLAWARVWEGYSDSERVFSFRDLKIVAESDKANVALGQNNIQISHHSLECAL